MPLPAALVLVVALCGVAACSRADRAAAMRDTVATNADVGHDTVFAALVGDTVVQGDDGTDALRLDSLRARMARLEDALARGDDRDHPRLLLELGRTKRVFIAPYDGPHAAYARSRPGEYMYDEIGGRHLYRGSHLRELVARFPAHALADDAAWQLTLLTPAGECEGFVICHIESRWRMVRDFLGTHPDSPYAARALDRAIAAFDDHLRDVTDVTRSSEFYDAAGLPPLLADFDSVTARLPAPLRERAATFSAGLRRRMARR